MRLMNWLKAVDRTMSDTKALPKMCTIKEAAELSGLSQYRLRTLCKERKITYVRCGTKFLINLDRLIDYLNEGDPDE